MLRNYLERTFLENKCGHFVFMFVLDLSPFGRLKPLQGCVLQDGRGGSSGKMDLNWVSRPDRKGWPTNARSDWNAPLQTMAANNSRGGGGEAQGPIRTR